MENNMMNKSIILLSGGLDSLVSLSIALKDSKEVLALTFNYGQKSYEAELSAAKKIVDYYGIKHKIIDLPWLAEISTSSLNTDDDVPCFNESSLDDLAVTRNSSNSVWVPNRNALFVNVAACFAEAIDFDRIVIGANKEEALTFKDNSVEFIQSINNSFKNSMNKKVSLYAPLVDFTKDEIIKIGIENSVPFELLHSCYVSNDLHCGVCESCLRLKRALINNDRYDIVEKIFRK